MKCAELFSTWSMLSTLVIGSCSLHKDAKLLCISNSNLTSLTILNLLGRQDCDIALSTPNLILLMIIGFTNRQLSSTCNLYFLEKVHLEVFENNYLVNVSWLQVIYNVKTMTLSPSTLEILLTVRFMICLYFLF